MNIFKKISIFNKVTKIIKEVKKYFDGTSVDNEIGKIPEIKEAVEYLISLVKNA